MGPLGGFQCTYLIAKCLRKKACFWQGYRGQIKGVEISAWFHVTQLIFPPSSSFSLAFPSPVLLSPPFSYRPPSTTYCSLFLFPTLCGTLCLSLFILRFTPFTFHSSLHCPPIINIELGQTTVIIGLIVLQPFPMSHRISQTVPCLKQFARKPRETYKYFFEKEF